MTHQLLVRFGKRASSWDGDDVDHIRKTEFKAYNGGKETRPSTYSLDSTELTRAYSEHAAAALIDLPKSVAALDLRGLVDAIPTSGRTQFSFIHARHREVEVSSVDHLDAIISAALREREERRHMVTGSNVLQYVRSQLAEGDHEWTTLANSQRCHKWVLGCWSAPANSI